jgi:Predicted transcriptional regulators
MNIMGQRIRDCRKASNKTQKELAALLGVKEAAVSKWESGKVENIPRSTIKEMASMFDVNPCYIMGFSNDPNPPKGEATVYSRVTIELGQQASELLQSFMKMNQKGRDMAFATVNALANSPENTAQEKTELKNA